MFLHDTLQNAAPFILAAMAGLLCDRAGAINIALEGLMLAGALAGVVVASVVGYSYAGLVGAMAVGVAFAAVLAVVALHLRANIILAGFALNLLIAGGTVYFLYATTGSVADSSGFEPEPLPQLGWGALDSVPVLDSLSGHSIVVYLALVSVPAIAWFLHRTRTGTYIRAVGENEAAVVEAGLRPRAIRWQALLMSGALCGLAGAQLSMDTTHSFVRDMTQGRGFIALGAVYLGARHPVGTGLAALALGAFEALATTIQVETQAPTEAVQALPYVATIVALVIAGARMRKRAYAAS
jgi:general nucleoside transport system permease protein